MQAQTTGVHLFMEYSLDVLNGGRYLKQPGERFPLGLQVMIHEDSSK